MKINKEDFTYTTDYIWCMEVVVLFRTTTEGCVWDKGFLVAYHALCPLFPVFSSGLSCPDHN